MMHDNSYLLRLENEEKNSMTRGEQLWYCINVAFIRASVQKTYRHARFTMRVTR